MKKLFILVMLPLVLFLGASMQMEDSLKLNGESSVWEVLKKLGEPEPNHTVNSSVRGYNVEAGKKIVLEGTGHSAEGKKARLQSKHFVCTSCHNVAKEDPDLSVVDAQGRLDYCAENNLPFLQGTTLYGAVNRTSFYNDDYEKKYGELVEPARNNLREAIQLCAVECSQGRRLKTWELESVLGYLWTLELKMKDLNLAEADYNSIESSMNNSTKEQLATRDLIKSKYLSGSPAHFIDPPADRKNGSGLTGDPENGKKIYEIGCMHCHEKERYSFFNLEDAKQDFCYLKSNFANTEFGSIYQVGRYGTKPHPGKRAYMPQYTKEKMSRQQMEDLRAYIVRRAGEK